MIHPAAADDSFLAPIHRSLLTSCLLSGTVALFVFPLHLALAGPPHAATILVLAWMLCQWPIAHYLSRTGAMNATIALSSGLFASFVAAVCLMTGGKSSFALLWLLIPPVEAAFATSRRVTIGVSVYCCALFAAVTAFSASVPQSMTLPPEAGLFASIAAFIYTGMLAARISLDRHRASSEVLKSGTRLERVSNTVCEVLLELDRDGGLSVLGGPVRKMFGLEPSFSDQDWVFHRLNVSDRPKYLTCLADAREGGRDVQLDVRLRLGSSKPGEGGQAEYSNFRLRLRPADTSGAGTRCGSVVLALQEVERQNADADPQQGGHVAGGKACWTLIEEAGASVRDQVSEIVDLASQVEEEGKSLTQGSLHQKVRRIRSAGDRSACSLNAMLDLVPAGQGRLANEFCKVDLDDCLTHSRNLIGPLADRLKVSLDLVAAADLPAVFVDKKKFRQSLHLILSEIVETAGAGALVHAETIAGPSGIELVMTVCNRQSSLHWTSGNSQAVFENASRLLEEAGAALTIRSSLGSGERVVVAIPVRAEKRKPDQSTGADAVSAPWAESA
ncbi:MAG: hypothetical protein RDA78_19150 [Roseibium sp.]|uniref:hypothetical protein n=1 Tax=Roseibium sp. TaxID=1936156 RepID=UPI003D9C145D